MRKLAFFLALVLLFSSASAESLFDMLFPGEAYEIVYDPSFELNGFKIDLDGHYIIYSHTEEQIELGMENYITISPVNLIELLELGKDFVGYFESEKDLSESLAGMLVGVCHAQQLSTIDTGKNDAGIYYVSFTGKFIDGMYSSLYAINGQNAINLVISQTYDFAQAEDCDLEEYLIETTKEIFADISIA